jgi:hypothetical protein
MALAINAYKSGSFTSIHEAAVTYEVSYTTLRARLQGRVSRQEIRSANLKLTDTEEQTLVNWILSMDERGLPVRTALIRDMANLLLQKRTGTRLLRVQLDLDGHITSYDVTTPYGLDIIENTTINVPYAKIQKLFETGFGSYEIQLQNMGFRRRTSTTLMRLAFKWELLQLRRLLRV